jgi:hypothetical protein
MHSFRAIEHRATAERSIAAPALARRAYLAASCAFLRISMS